MWAGQVAETARYSPEYLSLKCFQAPLQEVLACTNKFRTKFSSAVSFVLISEMLFKVPLLSSA
jgi:hypothetical protein